MKRLMIIAAMLCLLSAVFSGCHGYRHWGGGHEHWGHGGGGGHGGHGGHGHH